MPRFFYAPNPRRDELERFCHVRLAERQQFLTERTECQDELAEHKVLLEKFKKLEIYRLHDDKESPKITAIKRNIKQIEDNLENYRVILDRIENDLRDFRAELRTIDQPLYEQHRPVALSR